MEEQTPPLRGPLSILKVEDFLKKYHPPQENDKETTLPVDEKVHETALKLLEVTYNMYLMMKIEAEEISEKYQNKSYVSYQEASQVRERFLKETLEKKSALEKNIDELSLQNNSLRVAFEKKEEQIEELKQTNELLKAQIFSLK